MTMNAVDCLTTCPAEPANIKARRKVPADQDSECDGRAWSHVCPKEGKRRSIRLHAGAVSCLLNFVIPSKQSRPINELKLEYEAAAAPILATFRTKTYAIRQLISQNVQTERLRRQEEQVKSRQSSISSNASDNVRKPAPKTLENILEIRSKTAPKPAAETKKVWPLLLQSRS